MLQILEVEKINLKLQSLNKETLGSQGISELISLGGDLMGWIAFTGHQMALAKQQMNEAALQSHRQLQAMSSKMPPSLQNDFVKRSIGEQEYKYDLCERTNRACVHTLDFLRSAISALKAEAFAN